MASTLELILLYLVAAVAGVVACRLLRLPRHGLPDRQRYCVIRALASADRLAQAEVERKGGEPRPR